MAIPNALGGPGRVLDTYSIKARWSPIFLVVLPPLILCFAFMPTLPAWNKLWPLLGAGGVVILADQLGRGAGKRIQSALWDSWGGAPTTAALRHRDTANPVQLARQHEQIAALMGQALPTAADELADPEEADHAYHAAIAFLIARTRGRRQEFPLIFVENCNYGFRRNMLGLRTWGMSIAAITGLLALAATAAALVGLVKFSIELLAAVLIVSIMAVVIWRQVVTSDWVRQVACAYAERLLEAAETLT